MSTSVAIPKTKIAEFCRKWGVVEFSLFGSVLRKDFRPDSDIDVMVAFSPDAAVTLFDIVRMEEELEEILGRKVDLVIKETIERSRNYLRRRAILESREVIYAA